MVANVLFWCAHLALVLVWVVLFLLASRVICSPKREKAQRLGGREALKHGWW
jgi:hypothetical protein